jgi:hypothetical protein
VFVAITERIRPRTAGHAVPGHLGDRSVQRLQLVSRALAAAVLGAPAAGHRSDDQTWRPLPGHWGGSAKSSAPDVSLAASGPWRDAQTLEFSHLYDPVRRQVERLLEADTRCGHPKTAGVCRELKLRPALWTFVHLEGVEPTNNASERALRPGVLWRKGSFGTQSVHGSRVVEAMMTVVATLSTRVRLHLHRLWGIGMYHTERAPTIGPWANTHRIFVQLL